VPFKTLAAGEGINYTAGLPVIRTSPDHGTAFDIAGKDMADPSSFREALFAAIDLLRNRKRYAESTANPLQRGKVQKERY
jgi:4-hydroxythreonine-4-phosphate dehydrogenase